MLYNYHLTNHKTAIRINDKNIASISITSKQIGKDLLKLGFDSNKTKTWKQIPKLPNELYRHFVRGYFDGDGSISLNTRKANNRLSGFNRRASFTCYNKNILEQISEIVDIEFIYRKHEGGTTVIKGRETSFENCWLAEICSFENLKKLHNYLYKDAKYFYLRKKQKFDLAILNDKDCYATLQGNLY
jgi:intein-encoded DNA endonuclease-like protein